MDYTSLSSLMISECCIPDPRVSMQMAIALALDAQTREADFSEDQMQVLCREFDLPPKKRSPLASTQIAAAGTQFVNAFRNDLLTEDSFKALAAFFLNSNEHSRQLFICELANISEKALKFVQKELEKKLLEYEIRLSPDLKKLIYILHDQDAKLKCICNFLDNIGKTSLSPTVVGRMFAHHFLDVKMNRYKGNAKSTDKLIELFYIAFDKGSPKDAIKTMAVELIRFGTRSIPFFNDFLNLIPSNVKVIDMPIGANNLVNILNNCECLEHLTYQFEYTSEAQKRKTAIMNNSNLKSLRSIEIREDQACYPGNFEKQDILSELFSSKQFRHLESIDINCRTFTFNLLSTSPLRDVKNLKIFLGHNNEQTIEGLIQLISNPFFNSVEKLKIDVIKTNFFKNNAKSELIDLLRTYRPNDIWTVDSSIFTHGSAGEVLTATRISTSCTSHSSSSSSSLSTPIPPSSSSSSSSVWQDSKRRRVE